ncbi:MAG: TatD family hydrolase [Pseudomonadales bacterium]|nr:TatD family hydrolase [Pseudomonadales bacterium]
MIDIGANLSHDSFDHDLVDVVARANEAGLQHIILTGTSLASIHKALGICRSHHGFSVTAGIHPHEAAQANQETLTEIRQLTALPEIVAIGETGLDFNRNYSPHPDQERVFEEHLALACDLDLPVFLHQRDAHHRFLPILKSFRDELKGGGVVHCFTGSREELYAYLDLDMYIGLTGWICDERRGQDLLPLIREIPANRLLLETDSPYLLPRSLKPRPKGRRNEPAMLTEVLRMVSAQTGRSCQQLAQETTANAVDLFHLELSHGLTPHELSSVHPDNPQHQAR